MIPSFRRFEVRTLDTAGLRSAAQDLAQAALRGFRPDCILGIRSGGYAVAELMAAFLPQAELLAITCRRPSTKHKQKSGFIKSLLFSLPRWITDRLRIVEHIALTQWRAPRRFDFTPDPQELSAIAAALAQRGGKAKLLIVDDAVDSGATLAAVLETIRAMAGPDAVVKTAALTVTTAHPLIQPDFFLYRYVLCRFPWSLDFAN